MRLLICLLLWAGPAMAADPPPAACWAKPAGSGSKPYLAMNSDGFAVRWYCKDGSGWKPEGFVGHWSELPGDWLSQVTDLIAGTDAQRSAAWTAGMKDGDYGKVWPLMIGLKSHDAQYPLPPPEPAYVVAKNGTYTTRPYYGLTSTGTRKTTKSGDIAIGKPCGAQLEGAYRSVTGQTDSQGRVIAAGMYAYCAAP